MRIPLKALIFITIGLSLLSGFLPEITSWLVLSWTGIKNLFLWQLITYIFIERGPLSLGFFLNLAFHMYILWMFGSHLLDRSRTSLFLALYLGAAFSGGLSALIFPNTILAGSTNGVFAVLIAWMLLNQGSELLLFFALPFKAQWLILGLIAATLLIDLTNSYWAEGLSLAISCIYSYLFTVIVWRQPSPFFFLRKFEKRIFQFLERKKKREPYSHSKIYDIKSGEPVLDDNQFMDAMLDRISRHGEDSLTPAEKNRMKEISGRKK